MKIDRVLIHSGDGKSGQ